MKHPMTYTILHELCPASMAQDLYKTEDGLFIAEQLKKYLAADEAGRADMRAFHGSGGLAMIREAERSGEDPRKKLEREAVRTLKRLLHYARNPNTCKLRDYETVEHFIDYMVQLAEVACAQRCCGYRKEEEGHQHQEDFFKRDALLKQVEGQDDA